MQAITTLRLLVCVIALASSTFAQLPPVPTPAENPSTPAKTILGKILYWDEQLSSDNTVSCGTCHIPSHSFSDPRMATHPGRDSLFGTADDVLGSPGIISSDANNRYQPDSQFGLDTQVTNRNSPTIPGSQWANELFWDGRAPSTFLNPETGAVSIASGGALESQVSGPPVSDVEMAHTDRDWSEINQKLQGVRPLSLARNIPADMAAALLGNVRYPELFQDAFGDPGISGERIAFAIASYERSLIPDQTPWDRFVAGDNSAMTPGQIAGWNFLRNQSLCLNCHTPPLFTDNRFHNIGLRPSIEDTGRMAVTNNPADRGRFKTPSLRNVGLRNSLMHVGWVDSVQDAVAFYNAPPFPLVSPQGHSQFTADQDRIPTANPNVSIPFNQVRIPPPVVPAVVDFLQNALTDPRIAAEAFPFDRPTLHSELQAANPRVFRNGSAGSGGLTSRMLAISPPRMSNPDFKLGLHNALGGAQALLLLSLDRTPPNTFFGQIPVHVVTTPSVPFLMTLSGAGQGAGKGYATFKAGIPFQPSLVGMNVFGQWFVGDAQAPDGIAASNAGHWRLF